MAITVDVQNDKFPYFARQFCGDIATAFGYGIDHVYEEDLEFINFLLNFSLDTLSGQWLDMLGVILGFSRPYSSKPPMDDMFLYDNTDFLLDGVEHGFSTTVPVIIDGVQYDRDDGGYIDTLYTTTDKTPVSDETYKKYLQAIALVKTTHSIKSMSDVLSLFIDSTRFAITFKNDTGYVNDIIIFLSATTADYKEFLQTAFNTIFTVPPFVMVTPLLDFDNVYTVPVIEGIIQEVTGSDTGYTVVFSIENKKAVFTITLDSSLALYEDAVREALELHFAGSDDVIIIVQVE